MKKITLLYTIAFAFFVIGEVLWSIKLFNQNPIFNNGYIDDWVINIMFTFFGQGGVLKFVTRTKEFTDLLPRALVL